MQGGGISTPWVKRYDFTLNRESADSSLVALVGYEADELCSVAHIRYEAWNRRAILCDMYVHKPFRRKGNGKQMLNAAEKQLSQHDVRCLWLETQNINVRAIHFYRSAGFEICGWDASLYDAPHEQEIAIFMSKRLN